MNRMQTMVFRVLKQKNPQIAEALQQCINQGQSPQQVLGQLIEAGQVSKSDLQKLKNNVGMVNKLLGSNITQKDLAKFDSIFEQRNNGFRF